jgi:oligopeptide transport system ATP-binding protein
MPPLLDVRALETRFMTDSGAVKAVNGVSFQLAKGETLGIVGESGSGKSVTMLSVMRLIPSPPGQVSGGQVLFEGKDLLKLSTQQMRALRGNRIAMIFQDPMTSLNPVLTIGRQLTEPIELHMGLTSAQAEARAVDLLRLVGIPDPARRLQSYPHQFSGGMRQRVMIAMGLATNPSLLIADEPTTALDVTIQAQIVDLVKRLKHEFGMAIIWITHDLSLLAGLADRILVMYAGQIVEAAPLRELYRNPRHPYTIGLLQSVPRLDEERRDRLRPIGGFPPDLINYPTGCPFRPRCPYAVEQCGIAPPLEQVGTAHLAACWVKPMGIEGPVSHSAAV